MINIKKNVLRKLEDTSWLAQIIKDKIDNEFNKNGNSLRYNCLNTLYIIVQEADDKENNKIYYDNRDGKRQIIISEIPSLTKHGTNFDTYGMQCKLRGLAERYTDDDGRYLVSVATTYDLNTAKINDISELIYQMESH